ncbi:hypothetical protein C8R43DRAFT_957893 [Mycena crocata]|nr:hypothetical protein C8R43DRAFT_957893 [Mycena crocata]
MVMVFAHGWFESSQFSPPSRNRHALEAFDAAFIQITLQFPAVELAIAMDHVYYLQTLQVLPLLAAESVQRRVDFTMIEGCKDAVATVPIQPGNKQRLLHYLSFNWACSNIQKRVATCPDPSDSCDYASTSSCPSLSRILVRRRIDTRDVNLVKHIRSSVTGGIRVLSENQHMHTPVADMNCIARVEGELRDAGTKCPAEEAKKETSTACEEKRKE